MSHVISGLLSNTCLAGGLAIVVFLAQQSQYLRFRPQVCHAAWLLVLVKLISPTFFAIPVSIGLARSDQVRNEPMAVTTSGTGDRTSARAEPISAAGGNEAIPLQAVDVVPTPQLAVVDLVASNAATCPCPATAFGSCSALTRRVEMIVSQNSLAFKSHWASVFLFALTVLPIGIANADDEQKDWSAERREFVERIEELTREIEELRNEGNDNWAQHLVGRRDYSRGILPMLDQILELEQGLEKAQARQDFGQAEHFKDKLETWVDKFWRAERIGEMEGRLSELKLQRDELAEEREGKARQQVESFVADQEKLLKLLRHLHTIVETDDDNRIEKLEKQVDEREESLLLRIEQFHLERHMIEARREGDDVQQLEAELQEVRKALRELNGGSE
jgi:hypothetical protein